MPAYSTDKGFTGSTKDKDKNKSTSTGAGTKALASGSGAQTQPRDPAGPGGATSGGSGAGPGMKAYSTRADRGGGTTTTSKYSPGATDVYGQADGLTVFEKVALPNVPGVGAALGAATAGKMLLDGTTGPTTLLGGNPGPRTGYQPDRYKGRAQQTGLGAAEGDSSGEREIMGSPYNRNVAALVGDIGVDPITGDPTDYRDDVVLRDRRQPYSDLTAEQKRKQLLAMV